MNTYIPQVWEVSRDYPSHIPPDEEWTKHINIKTHDGTTWQGSFAAGSPQSGQHFRQMRNQLAANGVDLTAWCVPTGKDIATEIELASQVIEVSNQMVFDIEEDAHSPWFWKGNPTQARAYISELRRRFPSAFFTLQIDVRWITENNFYAWAPHANQVVGMDYWTDFYPSEPQSAERMKQVLTSSYLKQRQAAASFPGLKIGFTYPGPSRIYPDWQIDENPIYIFRRGNMTPELIELVRRSNEVGSKPDPEFPEGQKTVEQMIDDLFKYDIHLTERVAILERKIAEIGVAASGRSGG